MNHREYLVSVTSTDGKAHEIIWKATFSSTYYPWIDRIIDYVETGVWKGREKAGPVDQYRHIYSRLKNASPAKNIVWGTLCEAVSEHLSKECAMDEEYRKCIIKEANTIVRLQNKQKSEDVSLAYEQICAFEEDVKLLDSAKRYIRAAIKENNSRHIGYECRKIIRNFGLFKINKIQPMPDTNS